MGIYQLTDRIIDPTRYPWGWEGVLWTPESITTALWLDADDSSTITLVSGAVSQWNDKSGNGRHATQETANKRPSVVSDSVNGGSVIRLDGVDDEMALPSITATAGIRLYFVLRQNKGASGRNGGIAAMTSLASATGNDHFGGVGSPSDWFDAFFSTSRVRVSSTDIPTEVYLGFLAQTGTAIRGKVFGLIDNTENATFNGSPSRMSVGGNLATNIPLTYSRHDYAELILVQSPSEENQYKLEGYLAHKWGLTGNLPIDHPYKEHRPINE